MLDELRKLTPLHILDITERVWKQRDLFILWPNHRLLFMPGTVRHNHHSYTEDQKVRLRAAGVVPDRRSNGPAIVAYLLAGGERPKRINGRHGWSIHHIYDGKFPAIGKEKTFHAVKDGKLFTEAAGLVAIHPIADALADEVPYFAWLLRHTAFEKFGFDPDNVFSIKQKIS